MRVPFPKVCAVIREEALPFVALPRGITLWPISANKSYGGGAERGKLGQLWKGHTNLPGRDRGRDQRGLVIAHDPEMMRCSCQERGLSARASLECSIHPKDTGGFQRKTEPLFRAPMMRIKVYWSPFWGPHFSGNPHTSNKSTILQDACLYIALGICMQACTYGHVTARTCLIGTFRRLNYGGDWSPFYRRLPKMEAQLFGLFATAEAQGFSFLALCFSVGLFLGPILGGERPGFKSVRCYKRCHWLAIVYMHMRTL